MSNQFFFRFIIIDMFVFQIIIKYIRSISEFRDVETFEKRIDSRDLKKQINKFLN
jgi:molybdopterin/thiamine biosynthesis adenylyltransferase